MAERNLEKNPCVIECILIYECTLKSTSQNASFWIQLDRTFQCWKSFEKANLLGDEELSRSTLFIRLSAIARLHRRVESSMRQKMITSVGSGYVNNRFSQPLLLIDVAKLIKFIIRFCLLHKRPMFTVSFFLENCIFIYILTFKDLK